VQLWTGRRPAEAYDRLYMLNHLSRVRLAVAWCAAMIVLGALGVVAGVDITQGNGELLLGLCVVPPAAMLLIWRSAPAAAVPELVYAVDTPSTEATP
jgi:hypothetical protein